MQVTNKLRFSCLFVEQMWLERKQKKVNISVKKGSTFDV